MRTKVGFGLLSGKESDVEILFFILNALLVIGNTVLGIGFLLLFFQKKNRLYLWVAIMFCLYIVDVLVLYTADFVPSFSVMFLSSLESAPMLYEIIFIVMVVAYRMIIVHIFNKPMSVLEKVVFFLIIAVSILIDMFSTEGVGYIIASLIREALNMFIIARALMWARQEGTIEEAWVRRLVVVVCFIFTLLLLVDVVFAIENIVSHQSSYLRIVNELINILVAAAAAYSWYRVVMYKSKLTDDERVKIVSQEYGLTPREAEMLGFLYKGYSNKMISNCEYVSIGTVKTHTHNVYCKLGVNSRNEAVAIVDEIKPES